MATTEQKVLGVASLTKYGFQIAGGEYVNWSKNVKEKEKGSVVPGGNYNFELYIADSGKKYVNKVLGAVPIPDVLSKPMFPKTSVSSSPRATQVAEEKKATPKASEGMSKDEWAAKDQRISRQGVIQAAVQAIAPLVSLEQVFTEAEGLANRMLDFVNKK